MTFFEYLDGELHAESVPVRDIAAQFGTPCYIYSRAALTAAYQEFDSGFGGIPHLICYAVKANPNIAILNLFARLGSGFDIVSGGELQRVVAAGGDPGKTVFSGVGKTVDEMKLALNLGIHCFNVESRPELVRLNHVAGELGKKAPVSLRINPDVDPKTHPYISTGLKENKFGIPYEDAKDLYLEATSLPNIEIKGTDCHIGSQITELNPFLDAFDKMIELIDSLTQAGIHLSHFDIGGGIGIRYQEESPPSIADYGSAIQSRLQGRDIKVLIEPGRSLTGNGGILITKVEFLKHGHERNFAIVDAAMNDLMRPSLYDAYHEIAPVSKSNVAGQFYEVVGPVCESGDFLGHHRHLSLAEGDLLAVFSAGAYGMSMSSNYNTRPRVPEVLVDGDKPYLIREREKVDQLFASEHVIP